MTFLLVFKIVLLGLALLQLRNAKKRGWLAAYRYWYIGLCGYNLVASFVSGLLWDGVVVLWCACIAGFFASIAFDVTKLFKEGKMLKKRQAEFDAMHCEAVKNLEEAKSMMMEVVSRAQP